MLDKCSLLLSNFDKLRQLFTLYGLRPADYWRGFHDTEHPDVEDALEKTFELFEDGMFDFTLNTTVSSLIEFFCGREVGEKRDNCTKRIKMLIAFEDYFILYQEDVLDPNLWTKSPITTKYPEVHDILDDDNLFDLSRAQVRDDERVQYKADVFFYHPALSFHFLREFLDFCHRDATCARKIALDPRRILPAREYPIRLLEAYWFGPKFNLGKIDDRIHGIELAVHTRPPNSRRNLLSSKLDRTEFMWSMRDNLKTLQVEELIPIDKDNLAKRLIVRYIHTIRDVDQHAFIHLDGAIRIYSPEGYIHRFSSKLSDHPNSDGYFKLFRIDGKIPEQDWIDLIANFFSGNELIHEYFGQPLEE